MPILIDYRGVLPYLESREIQQRYIEERIAGDRADTLLLCEHPPTVTLGRRTADEDYQQGIDFFSANNIEIHRVERGGSATYHGPGQLVIYPVISLRERQLGVKDFVESGLKLLAEFITDFGLDAEGVLCPAGVWIRPEAGAKRKIGAVGLRINHGVTDHGFSLNIASDIDVYSRFRPCGMSANITSLGKELELKGRSSELIPVSTAAQKIAQRFENLFGN